MTLRVAHEGGFAAAMVLGLVGLLWGGELPPLCWLSVLAVPLSSVLHLRKQPLNTTWGGLIGLVFMAIGAQELLRDGLKAALHGACIFLVGIVVARLLTRVWPSHDLQALVLSLLAMFAGTLLHQGFTYALVLVAYTVAATWALLTGQLIAGCTQSYFRHGSEAELNASLARRDVVTLRFGLTVAALAWAILLTTGVLFVVFPRVGLGGLQLGGMHRTLGESVSLTGAPRASGGDEVVVRLRGVPVSIADDGLYLRGRIFDALDRAGFHRSADLEHLRPSLMGQVSTPDVLSYEVEGGGVEGEPYLTLGPALHATRVRAQGLSGRRDAVAAPAPTGELMGLEAQERAQRLRVTGYRAPLRLKTHGVADDALGFVDPLFTEHFLALPPGLDPRIAPLAAELVAQAPRFGDRARALRTFLLQQFSYTLEQPNAGRDDPLAAFLFDDRRGHCEYFAAAYAVLLRAAGVPARVVGGYQGGTWDPINKQVVFSNRNAHAWVEWYLPHAGWVVDDATPPSSVQELSVTAQWLERIRSLWDDTIMDYGLSDQWALWQGTLSMMKGSSERVALPLQAQVQHAPRAYRQGVMGLVLLAVACAGLWAARQLARRRRAPALKRALDAVLGVHLGTAYGPALGYSEGVSRLLQHLPSLSVQERALLTESSRAYVAYRFGHTPLPPKSPSWCRSLHTLAARRPRA